MAGVIEVSLLHHSITPLDREEDEYWTQGTRLSALKGGTWTTFNWNHLITGHATQRIQYSRDLKVPQAEVDLEELFEYLVSFGQGSCTRCERYSYAACVRPMDNHRD